MNQIKNKLDEIFSIYEQDEKQCGGYSMTKYARYDAPEDYNEYRTEWSTLRDRADDMCYMLSCIKSVLKECKELLED